MKLKFKQSIATADQTYQYGQEYEIDNLDMARSLIGAGFAVEVVAEKPSTKVVEKVEETEVKEKPQRKKAPKASDK